MASYKMEGAEVQVDSLPCRFHEIWSSRCRLFEWCTFIEFHGSVEDMSFYAFTIFIDDDFNYAGKALPKEGSDAYWSP
jgi:hypothetical protein